MHVGAEGAIALKNLCTRNGQRGHGARSSVVVQNRRHARHRARAAGNLRSWGQHQREGLARFAHAVTEHRHAHRGNCLARLERHRPNPLLVVRASPRRSVTGHIAEGQNLIGRLRQANLKHRFALARIPLDQLGVAHDQGQIGATAVVVQDHPLGLQPRRISSEDRAFDVGQLKDETLVRLQLGPATRRHRHDGTGLPCRNREGANDSIEVKAFLGRAADGLVAEDHVRSGRLRQRDHKLHVGTEGAIAFQNLGTGNRQRRQYDRTVIIQYRRATRSTQRTIGNPAGGLDRQRETLRSLDKRVAQYGHTHLLNQCTTRAEGERTGHRNIVATSYRRTVAGREVQRQVRTRITRQAHQEDRLALARIALDDTQVIHQQGQLVARAIVVQDRPRRPQARHPVRKHGTLRIAQLEDERFVQFHRATAPAVHHDRARRLARSNRQLAANSVVVERLPRRRINALVVDYHWYRRRLRQGHHERETRPERAIPLHHRHVRYRHNRVCHGHSP